MENNLADNQNLAPLPDENLEKQAQRAARIARQLCKTIEEGRLVMVVEELMLPAQAEGSV